MTDKDKKYCDGIAVRVMEILLKDENARSTCEGSLNYEGIASTSYVMALAMLHARKITTRGY